MLIEPRCALLVSLAIACHDNDPPFDIVRVPETAYWSDASARDGAPPITHDAGREPIVVCFAETADGGEDQEVADEYSNCLLHKDGRTFDQKATDRHRKKGDDSEVCCYRHGGVPKTEDRGE